MLRRTFLQTAAAAGVLAGLGGQLTAYGANAVGDPLLDPWTGAHGGFPPFDKITAAAIKPAMLKAMDLNRAEIAAIAANPEPANFDNTLLALERSGQEMGRVGNIYNIYTSVLNDKAMQAVEAEMAPILSAFSDEITQNSALFARIKAVYDARESTGLMPEQQRLALTVYDSFVRSGAALDDAQKTRMKAINQRLATLYTTFSQNVLADEESDVLVLESEADLDGLSAAEREAAKTLAAEQGQAGKWLIANTRSSMEPFLTNSTRRDLREKGWRMWTSRGDKSGPTDNKGVISEILQLRTERAKMLGYASHAHWSTADNMARTPDAAVALMMKVWEPAVARVREEVADMQALADGEKAGITIEPWDYRFYAEKVRKARFDIDENEVKPYLQLDKMREGMFWAAGKLYGLQFALIQDVPVYQSDVTVYEVTRDGQRVGLWYFDPYARAGKNSGAWMNEYRAQERVTGNVTPIVSNNSNFNKPGAGSPVLLSWDDAVTMFHEFGHALHGLSSNVTYPTLAGTRVYRDFVEFPSQINERWLPTPEVLNTYAVHAETGAPMPQAMVDKIDRAKTFNQGFLTIEYLASAIYDMQIHLEAAKSDAPIDPDAFEKSALGAIGMPKEIVMRHRPTAFGHSFSGDGYSAGYYVYLWADALTSDAFDVFREKGVYDTVTAKNFLEMILAVGNSVPPEEAFRRFRGRDVDTEALMRERGFV